jgi:glutathione S-transferase
VARRGSSTGCRRQVRRRLRAQGIGAHSGAEIAELGAAAVRALAEAIGDNACLMGAEPCGADATAFAFAAGVLCPHFDGPIRRAAESHPNLVAYERRMRARFYPEPVVADQRAE